MTGMFLATNSPQAPGTRLRIEVLEGDRGFVVEGVVAHARKTRGDMMRLSHPGMGIRFLGVDELVRELIPSIPGDPREDTEEIPRSPSAPSSYVPPPAAPARVEVKGNKVEINEKIQFDVNKATIKPESNGLLDEIAQVIKANPTIKKILVEGHSSSEGDAKANLKLSDDRAKAVVAALESRGVAKGILTAKGFGSTEPIDKGTTEAAREKNRRVEFTILDPKSSGDAGAPTAPTATKDGGK